MRIVPSLLMACLSAQAAMAQQVIGRAELDGREIALLDSGKWVFTEDGTSDCIVVAGDVSFCGVGEGWTTSLPGAVDASAAFKYDDNHLAQFVIEGIGSDQGLTQAVMLEAVISNAAIAAGQTTKDVIVLVQYDSVILGRDAVTVVYQFDIDGLEVVYANGIYTSPNQTVQALTYSIATEFTDQHRFLHDQFLSFVQRRQ